MTGVLDLPGALSIWWFSSKNKMKFFLPGLTFCIENIFCVKELIDCQTFLARQCLFVLCSQWLVHDTQHQDRTSHYSHKYSRINPFILSFSYELQSYSVRASFPSHCLSLKRYSIPLSLTFITCMYETKFWADPWCCWTNYHCHVCTSSHSFLVAFAGGTFVDWTSNTLPKPMIVYGKFNEVYTIGGLHYDSHMQCHSRAVYTLLPAQLWNFSCCHYLLCFTKSQTRWNRPLSSYLYDEWEFQFSSRPNCFAKKIYCVMVL